jgi:BirA family biotin operon repressor/biotin-[acetyl-CoA-carboxylase] ligase
MAQFDAEKLQHVLGTQTIGRGDRFRYVPVIDSTNILAMKLALQGVEEGVVVLTDSQTAGKGRQGRRWIDMAGSTVLSSTILRPLFPPHLLVMISALAVVAAIIDTCQITATIKWPNDILIGERKVAGILIETSHDYLGHFIAIVGIGVNVNGRIAQFVLPDHHQLFSNVSLETPIASPNLAATATTLEDACGYALSRESFLASLLQHLEPLYLALQQEAQSPTKVPGPIARLVREEWRSQLATLGRTIQVRQGTTLLSGVAEDVNEHGELLLRTHSGYQELITWGDVDQSFPPALAEPEAGLALSMLAYPYY